MKLEGYSSFYYGKVSFLIIENYLYKTEVKWSLLHDGFTIPVDDYMIFARKTGGFLKKGEEKVVSILFEGNLYEAKIKNQNIDPRHNRKSDILQLRFNKNSDLSKIMRSYFYKTYEYLQPLYEQKIKGASNRKSYVMPDKAKEYLAVYATADENTYIFDPIYSNEIDALKHLVAGKQEREMEAQFNYDTEDSGASLFELSQVTKLRKLNRKIGDNLKLYYDYRCQICGQYIGEKYASHVVEAHHIEYFVQSLNNDASNQMIVCPNHHSIIHDTNPIFDRKKLVYIYPNGYKEGLALN